MDSKHYYKINVQYCYRLQFKYVYYIVFSLPDVNSKCVYKVGPTGRCSKQT